MGGHCRSGQKGSKHVAGVDIAGVSLRDAVSQGNHFTASRNSGTIETTQTHMRNAVYLVQLIRQLLSTH